MKQLVVIVALVACGDTREVPAPKPREAHVTAPRVAPALPVKQVPGLVEDLRDPAPKVRRAAVR